MILLFTTKSRETIRRELRERKAKAWLKARSKHIKYCRAIGRGKHQEIE